MSHAFCRLAFDVVLLIFSRIFIWEFDTTDRYFAIVIASSAAYLSSIEITYAAPCTNHTGGTPTCTEPAKCENCGAEYGEPAGHTEETIPAQAPTCTEDGLTAGVKCSVCETVLTAPQVDPATGRAISAEYDLKWTINFGTDTILPFTTLDSYTITY